MPRPKASSKRSKRDVNGQFLSSVLTSTENLGNSLESIDIEDNTVSSDDSSDNAESESDSDSDWPGSESEWGAIPPPITYIERAERRRSERASEALHIASIKSEEKRLDGCIDRKGGAKDKTGRKRGRYTGNSVRSVQRKRAKIMAEAMVLGKDEMDPVIARRLAAITLPKDNTEQSTLSCFFTKAPTLASTPFTSTLSTSHSDDRMDHNITIGSSPGRVESGSAGPCQTRFEEEEESEDDEAVIIEGRRSAQEDRGTHDQSEEAGLLGRRDGQELGEAAGVGDGDDGWSDEEPGEGDAEVEREAMLADDAAGWVNDVLDNVAPKAWSELRALAEESLKKARKAHLYQDEVLYASLVDFYRWVERQGRMKAADRVTTKIGRGPAFARVLCAQAKFFEVNGAVRPSQQGKRKKIPSLFNDEAFQMGIQVYLRTLEPGKITPKLLQQHITDHILPTLNTKKTRISTKTAKRMLVKLGYRRKRHSKGVYWDGHERKDVRTRRAEYLQEMAAITSLVARYEGDAMEEVPPTLAEGEKEHVVVVQDESSLGTNDYKNVSYWLKPGEQVLKKKDRGRTMMVSGFLCERYGNLALTDEMIELNAKLAPDVHIAVTDSRVTICPTSKAGGDDYWNLKQMTSQLRNAILIAHRLFPGAIVHWVFDNSSCHDSMDEDALNVSKMNVNPGGTNIPKMHATTIPHDNPFGHGGKTQFMEFEANLPDDHEHKSHEGKPKGMRVILQERGYIRQDGKFWDGSRKIIGKCAACKDRVSRKPKFTLANEGKRNVDVENGGEDDDDEGYETEDDDGDGYPTDCCMQRILSLQSDFKSEKCLIEQIIIAAGDVCHFLPKFHPEMNPIEYFWGWMKRYFRERSNGNFAHGRKLLDESMEACPLVTIRRFFRRAQRYMSVYTLGATGIAAEHAVKKYKSHRGVSQKDLDTSEEERKRKDAKIFSGRT